VASVDFPASGSYFGVGRPGTIQATDSAAGVSTVHYSVDGGPQQTIAADASGSASIPFTATTAGQHWVDVQVVANGVTSMATRYVFSVPASDSVVGPTAYVQLTPGSGSKRTVSADMAKALHGTTPVQSYKIDFGDGTVAGPGPATGATHTYQSDGTFPVTVTVVDTDGLSDTAKYLYSSVTGQVTAPAPAPAPTSVSVNNAAGAGCSDTASGAGSQAVPFCTVSAAVAAAVPGETVDIADGTYHEDVTVARSGVPGSPIVVRAVNPGGVTIASTGQGTMSALTFKNVHDVTVTDLTIVTPGTTGVNATGQNLTLRDNTIDAGTAWAGTQLDTVAFRNVANGALIGNEVREGMTFGVTVDASSLRTVISNNTIEAPQGRSSALTVSAPGSVVTDNLMNGSYYTAISVVSSADHSVVANNKVTCTTQGQGIAVSASDTAVTSNTVMQNGNVEILVSGPVTGVTVENNITAIPDNTFYCGHPNYGEIGLTGISVDAAATGGTTEDYNDVYFPLFTAYHWGNTDYASGAFQQQTGQGVHDSPNWVQLDASGVPKAGSPAIDSANSAARGEQLTDLFGNQRADDPNTPNTGAGPRTYDDRGAMEFQPSPVPPPGGGPTPTPTPTPSPNPVPAGTPDVSRLYGGDRYGTSVAVSRAQWKAGAAGAVVLATGANFPDALSGVPLAAHVHGPLLLTDPARLDGATTAELSRVLGPDKSKTVYILGGTGAVSSGVERQIRELGYHVQRFGGSDRYATSLQIAQDFGTTKHVIVATGQNFADALSAGPLGAAEGAPVVLSQDAVLDPATAAFVAGHPAIEAVGGQALKAVSALPAAGHSVTPLAGLDRYATSEAVATALTTALGHAPTGVGLSSGVNFPDALTGGAYAANAGMPLLLTDPRALPDSTAATLAALAPHLTAVTLFGGNAAISSDVEASIAKAVHGRVQ
jgi:putative cell wall-binding protein